MRYISGVKAAEKSPPSRMAAEYGRQMPKRKKGRRNLSEWRDRQLFQMAACLWALKVVFEENADASEWRDQINSALVRDLTGEMKSSGLSPAALAVAAYDFAGGSTRARKGSVAVKGVSSPEKVLPLSRRMVCYWRASQDYQRAVELISGRTKKFWMSDLHHSPTAPVQRTSTEFSDYQMEIEIRKERAKDLFTRRLF